MYNIMRAFVSNFCFWLFCQLCYLYQIFWKNMEIWFLFLLSHFPGYCKKRPFWKVSWKCFFSTSDFSPRIRISFKRKSTFAKLLLLKYLFGRGYRLRLASQLFFFYKIENARSCSCGGRYDTEREWKNLFFPIFYTFPAPYLFSQNLKN